MKKTEQSHVAGAAKRTATSAKRRTGKDFPRGAQPTDAEIDAQVVREADDNSAWGPLVTVSRSRASVGLPSSLAQRAAFLAQLHRERNLQSWVERVVRERVELEERAFVQARRELGAKSGA